MRRFLFLSIAALIAACYQTPQPECAFACDSDGLCPDGYSCRADSLCRRTDVPDDFACPNVSQLDADTPVPDSADPDGPIDAMEDPDASAAALESDPTEIDFNTVPIGSPEQTRTVTVRNTGMTPSGNLEITFTPDPGSEDKVYIVAGENRCADRVLEGTGQDGDDCTIMIGFAPESVQLYGATLAIAATPGGGLSIRIDAEGVEPAP